ncbi:MAG: hypothetical protein H7336_17160 [Bacteriovorax sp.]|nr:hypothetical protein [Bacteriovorax sp.]
MNSHTLTLLFLSLCQSFSSYAFDFSKKTSKECTSVDLRASLGSVRNQGSAGWCFAYATAELLSYKIEKKISAAELALNFYIKMPEMPRGDFLSKVAGGSDMGAMTYSTNGFCAEEDMPSENYKVSKECLKSDRALETLDIIRLIENIHQTMPATLTACQVSIVSSLFKNLNANEIQTKLLDRKLTSLEKISNLKDANCSTNRIRPAKKLKMKSGMESRENSIVNIDKQLDTKNPVSLNYNANFLLKNANPNEIGNHYSVIVGRRKSSNSCQYLIRNSWGQDCSIYPAPFNTQCEQGNIWVDENVLTKSIIDVHFIQ